MAMAERAAVNEKNQKKMERTIQTSCKVECRSHTDARGSGGWGSILINGVADPVRKSR